MVSAIDRYLISNEDRQSFLENFGLMLTSGVAVVDILASLQASQKNTSMKTVVGDMLADVEQGFSLSEVFRKAQLFSPYVVSLISLGEQSGTLSNNFAMLALSEAREADFRSKVKSALLYPVIVVVVALIVGISVAWFILPKLSTVFSSLNLKLPLITKLFIGIGLFLNAHGLIAVPAFLVLLGVLVFFLFFFPKTKRAGEWVMMHTPGIGRILRETEVARMGTLLGTLLEAGMPVTVSLHALEEAATLHRYRLLYQHLGQGIMQGDSFEKSFRSYADSAALVPLSVQTLIFSGEKTGTLSQILQKIGDTYVARSELSAKNLATAIEPVLLVLIAGGVFAIALAVILPIYKLVGGISNVQ